MRLSATPFSDAKPFDGYGPGFFRVGGVVHEGAVICTAQGVQPWGGYDDTEALLALAGQVDVLFIGTGAGVAHIPSAFRTALEAAGLGIEAMDSPAACRTYNVLLSEGRRIGAAVLPV